MISKYVPQDAERLRYHINSAANAAGDKRYFKAEVHAISAELIALGNIFAYCVRGFAKSGNEIRKGNFSGSVVCLKKDLNNSMRSLSCSIIGIFLVVFGTLSFGELYKLNSLEAEKLAPKKEPVKKQKKPHKTHRPIEKPKPQRLPGLIDGVPLERYKKRFEDLKDENQKLANNVIGKRDEIQELNRKVHILESQLNLKEQVNQEMTKGQNTNLDAETKKLLLKGMLCDFARDYDKKKHDEELRKLQYQILQLEAQKNENIKSEKRLKKLLKQNQIELKNLSNEAAQLSIDAPWKSLKYRYFLDGICEFLEQRGMQLQTLEGIVSTKLQSNQKNELIKATNKLLTALNNPTSFIHTRDQHTEFVQALREAILSSEYQDYIENPSNGNLEADIVAFIHQVCMAWYTGGSLNGLGKKLMKHAKKADKSVSVTSSNFVHLLEKQKKAINALPVLDKEPTYSKKANDLKGHLNIDFDPSAYRNLSYCLGENHYSSNHKVTILRTPTPTYQTKVSNYRYFDLAAKFFQSSSVVPEYMGFLNACKADKKKVAYFSYQNFIPKSTLKGNETNRCEALKQVAENKELQDTFYFTTFPLDSPFVKQTGQFSGEKDKKDFIDTFLAEMFDKKTEESGFYLQESRKADFFNRQNIAVILNHVGDVFFEGNTTLTEDEKLIFIILSYIEMEEAFTIHYQVDYAHSSCKDALDRHGVIAHSKHYLNLIKLGQENSSIELRNLLELVDSAPFLVKKQPMIDERREIFIKVFKHLSSLSESAKQKLKKKPNIKKIVTIENPKQTIYPSPIQAKNLEEYLIALQCDPFVFGDRKFEVEDFTENVKENTTYSALREQMETNILVDTLEVNGKSVTSLNELETELSNLGVDTSDEDLLQEIYALCRQCAFSEILEKLKNTYDNTITGIVVTQPRKANINEQNTSFKIAVEEESIEIIGRTKFYIRDSMVDQKPLAAVEGEFKASLVIEDSPNQSHEDLEGYDSTGYMKIEPLTLL